MHAIPSQSVPIHGFSLFCLHITSRAVPLIMPMLARRGLAQKLHFCGWDSKNVKTVYL